MCGDCYVVTWGLPEQARVSEGFINSHLSKVKRRWGRKEERASSTEKGGVASQTERSQLWPEKDRSPELVDGRLVSQPHSPPCGGKKLSCPADNTGRAHGGILNVTQEATPSPRCVAQAPSSR